MKPPFLISASLVLLSLAPLQLGAQAPSNDNFANRWVLSGRSATTNGSSLNSSPETGEPLHAGINNRRSVWFEWTAPTNGVTRIDTLGSAFNTLLGVYTGTSVDALSLVVSNDDISFCVVTQSMVHFLAIQGTSYKLAIDGRPNCTSTARMSGAYTLNVQMVPFVYLTSPVHNSFYAPGAPVPVSAEVLSPNGPVTQVQLFRGATLLATDTVAPYATVDSTPPLGLHAYAAVVTDNTGLKWTSEVASVTVSLPGVAITSPADGASFFGTTPITIQANAFTTSGAVARVEFFTPYGKAGESLAAPFSAVWTNVLPGAHALTAIMTDSLGMKYTSAPVNITVTGQTLVLAGSVWKYLDNGSDQGTAWRAPDFNDSAWASGPAQLGYGDGDEATVVGFGPDPNNRYITTYFRHRFVVGNPAGWTNLLLRVLRDDGAVAYLNGVEVARFNMPAGEITSTTTTANAADEISFFPANVSPSLLGVGTNVLAVEIHQTGPTSSDISFDLELIAEGQAGQVVLTSPADRAQFAAPATITLSAVAVAAGQGSITNVRFFQGNTLIDQEATSPYSVVWPNVPVGTYTLRAVATDNSGASLVSAPVTIAVSQMTPASFTLVPTGSVWKYLDNGSDQGTAWRTLGFNDSTWASGPAELGYGDAADGRPEATVVGYGPDANNKYVTTYFRRMFQVTDATQITNLTVRLVRDDGAAVYLNGQEIARDGLPAGALFNTFANITVGGTDETTYFEFAGIPAGALVSGANVIAAEVHQVNLTSSDLSFDLQLVAQGWIPQNQPPVVSLTSPPAGWVFPGAMNVPLSAVAQDFDGIQRVEFYAGGTFIGQDTTVPYSLDWSNPLPAIYALTAVAVDGVGARGTSSVVTVTVNSLGLAATNSLIAAGAVWKYLDNGSDQGTAWRASGFDDSAWVSGPAQLGYGEGDEATVVGFGPDPNNRYITTYFRRAFTVAGAAACSNLFLRLLRDDGGVVYLNGTEIFRSPNMPAGAITYTTLTVPGQNGENTIDIAAIAPSALREGPNVIAVEIHQAQPTSSDLSFDFELSGVFVAGNLRPTISLTQPANGATFAAPAQIILEATASDLDGTIAKVEFFQNGVWLGETAASPHRFVWSNVPQGTYALTAVATDNQGASATSSVVNITVSQPVTLTTNVLVAARSVWKYLDNGSDQGTAWQAPSFNDSAWTNGPGILGYGEGDEGTVVGYGPSADSKYITTYFRRTFFVPDVAGCTNLIVRLIRDDGAAVYLNGSELVRDGLPVGAGYNTLASITTVAPNERTYFAFQVSPAALVNGTNVLAAEVHQVNATSSDLSFDLELLGVMTRTEVIRLTSPTEGATFSSRSNIVLTAVLEGQPSAVTNVTFLANSTLLGAVTAGPYSLTWSNPPAGSFALRAVAMLDTGAQATSGPVNVTVEANLPPVVALTSPANGTFFNLGNPIVLAAAANDPDGTVTQVEFFAGDLSLGQSAAGPFGLTWTNAPAGTHALRAVALDDGGLRATSAVVTVTVSDGSIGPTTTLISRGAIWKYLDTGVDQGSAWVEPGYDDATWPEGPAELGYGDGDEATVISFGPNPNAKYPTAYFRHAFTVTDPNAFTNLVVGFRRDDGGVVYLNGVEVFRSNMPDGPITYSTYAAGNAADDGVTYFLRSVSPFLLHNGVNVVAAEVHQANATSSDLSFDLELVANATNAPNTAPAVTLVSPTDGAQFFATQNILLVADATDRDGRVVQVEFLTNNVSLGSVSDSPFSFLWPNVPPGSFTIRARAFDNLGASTLSGPVNMVVAPVIPTVNDDFADRIVVEDLGTYIGSNMTATKEPGEPDHAGNSGGKSAWWSWTATTNGPVVITTAGSSFDTLLAVYTGSAVNALTLLASNDQDPLGGVTSRLTLQAVAGTTYHLAVDGANGNFGTVTLNLGSIPPALAAVLPAAGTVTQLTAITVTFTKPVTGVAAKDFLVNGVPASTVNGSGTVYTFAFPQPAYGAVAVTWAADQAIHDLAVPPNAFNSLASGATWQYQLVDTVPPTVVTLAPVPGATLRTLDEISVMFSEPVAGVNAADLLVNGSPATSLSGSGAGLYRFRFPATADGLVTVAWAGTHGIRDLAQPPNALAGGSWSYTANAAAVDSIVINEIMYHPISERTDEEYLELLNTGAAPINLTGWRFSNGIEFDFPGISLAGGAYLVVAADVAAFQARYPGVTNVIGGWRGVLSNRRENVDLDNALGERVDRVGYADEGDWGLRVRGPNDQGYYGWEWLATHDGGGKSLELRNPALPGNAGHNWASSLPDHGTPGRVNSTATNNIPPMIFDVTHLPEIPTSSDSVSVFARIVDELPVGLTVTLYYRNASTTTPPDFTATPMLDNGQNNDGAAGDGVYGVILPPQPNGTVTEFYVQAQDATGIVRTWPAAARQLDSSFAQTANALFQVDEGVYGGSQPIYRIIMTESERRELQNINRSSNAEMNATFITRDGTGIKVRHNVGVRIRGAGSRGAAVPNYRVNIPRDRTWNERDELNLNAQYGHSQLAGSALSLLAGLPVGEARAIQVRVNAANLAGTGLPQYGSYVLMEVVNGDWAAHHYPEDSNGNAYGARRPNTDLSYLGTNPQNYKNTGYSKTSNSSEDDWSDLINLTWILNNAPDSTYAAQVREVANVYEWMTYFAMNSLLGNGETALGSGVGDDYNMYRGLRDPRFLLVAHDWDTILGQGQGPAGVGTDIFRATAVPVVNRFLKHPEFAPLYYQELVRLMDTVVSPAILDPLLDQLLTEYVPPGTIASMKSYAVNRNAYVRTQIPLTLTAASALPVVSGYPRTTTPGAALSGRANVILTRSIRVNGLPATWTAWTGNWTISNVPLQPGLNRLLVQAFGVGGEEVARTSLDVWYDTGAPASVSGTLPGDTAWTAAGGPYLVSGNLIVPAGVTLSIQPGTTVYFAQGASLTVSGRLLAEGTAAQRLRFTRQPGTTDTWTGLRFTNTTEDNRLTYADVEFPSAADATMLQNAALFVDNVTWTGTTRTLIDLTNSSLHVRNSAFPAVVNDEVIRGTGIPANGYMVIEGNTFAGAAGESDLVSFTGGKRPGPILQVLNNVFQAGSDDGLDLNGADAHVEGNVFRHIRRDAPRASSANAIAADAGAEVTVARNLFDACDHAVLLQRGAFLTADNNTFVNLAVAAINFDETNRLVNPGRGARLDGNIFWNNTNTFENAYVDHPAKGTVDLVVNRSIIPLPGASVWPGLGNLNADPRFLDVARQDYRLAAGSPALSTGPNGLDMGAFVSAGASISGEPLSPTARTRATLTIGGPGITHYRYRLNGTYSAEFPVTQPIELTNLAPASYTVYLVGRNSAGVWQPETSPTASRPWTVSSAASPIVINEVLARNVAAVNVGGRFPDLIELRHAGDAPVDLAGLHLSDDPADPYKFTFPPGVIVAPGDYLVVYADDNAALPGLLLGFALSAAGESLSLYSSEGALLDRVEFGPQLADYSIGRLADGRWGLTLPTLGSPNVPASLGDARKLKINEWLADGRNYGADFIELFNPELWPVALGGLFLTDVPLGTPDRHKIAPLSYIAARGHAVFLADNQTEEGSDHLNFRLSPEQGMIGLYAPDLAPIDVVSYGPQTTDIAQGRSPSGANSIAFQSLPTPGAPNPASGQPDVTVVTVNLMNMTNVWKYEESGTDLGTDWRAPAYDDATWPAGAALFYVTTAALPAPRNTPLNQTPGALRRTTYFRTAVVVTTNLAGFQFNLSTILDDGAVIYLNGQEILRIGMPPGETTYDTLASTVVGTASLQTFALSSLNLLPGANIFAVEVHQSSAGSSDIVWGMALQATRTFTNEAALAVRINEVLANNASYFETDGVFPDWVELFNPTPADVDLSDLSLTDQLATPRRWVFPPGSILPANGYRIIRFDSSLPPAADNTGFGLSVGGDAVFLFDAPARSGALMDSVTFGLQAADLSLARVPQGNGPWVLALPTPGAVNIAVTLGNPALLKVNEWMAAPASGEDWFELHNPNPQPVALGGLYLTDNLGNRTKYQIPPRSFIGAEANGFARFWADELTTAGADHVSFRLSAGGEALGIFGPGGVQIDALAFGPQAPGVSEGRLPDGAPTFVRFLTTPTPEESNYLPLTNVVINEVLTHSDPPLEDAIELLNRSAGSADLSGWWLSDARNTPKKFRIPDGTVLDAGEFLVFYESEFNLDPNDPLSFALSSAKGDSLWLSAVDGAGNLTGYRGSVKFGPAENGVSFGRYQTSVGVDFSALSRRTFGVDDPDTVEQFRLGSGLPNAGPRVGPIVISEIMYHPPDLPGGADNVAHEFIELHNISAFPVTLAHPDHPTNTWRLRDAVKFNFPPGVVIPPGGHLLVVSFDPVGNPAALADFRSQYGITADAAMMGPYSGKLANNSDSVELYQPDVPQPLTSRDPGLVPYILVDRVHYSDQPPWDPGADGFGESLHRVQLDGYGNDPINWIAAMPTPGPQSSGPPDTDGDGMPDAWELTHGLNPNSAADAQQDLDGDGLKNRDEYLAGTNPTDPTSTLRLEIAVVGSSVLEFRAMPNRSYTIEYRDALDTGNWAPLIHLDAAPTNLVWQITDPMPGATRFYRVRTPRAP